MKRKVIIDCDPGIDDSLALMLALSCPEVEVIGITIVAGNTPTSLGFENAKKVLAHMHRLDIPIYIGEETPLVQPFVNALDTHGEDGLGHSFLPSIPKDPQPLSAVDFLIQSFSTNGLDLIALGPLTNLAKWIQKDPASFANIHKLVSMGGSYASHGNCSPVAEYNYWEDPDAAKIVYDEMARLGRKIHMIGLDVTRKIILTPTLISYIKRIDPYHGSFIEAITQFYLDFHWKQERIIGCVINDPLAVAYWIDPSLCSGLDAFTEIVTDGIARGQSVVDAYCFYQKEANAHILTTVDVPGFFDLFLRCLCPGKDLSLLKDLIR